MWGCPPLFCWFLTGLEASPKNQFAMKQLHSGRCDERLKSHMKIGCVLALPISMNMAETSDNDTLADHREAQTIHSSEMDELPKFYPKYRGKPMYNGNQEALGWALDGIGRALQFVGAGAFLGTALIRIAKEAAGCLTEPPEGETVIPECNEKVYGIKPSSLLTTYTMIVGVASACLLPLMGALIDYTPHRLKVGRIVSFIFTVLILPTIFLNEKNFLAVAIIQVVLSFTGWAQTALTYAYLPELTTDELLLNDYTKSFTMSSFGAMVVYLGVVIGALQIAGYGDDDLLTNKVGMSIAFGVNVIFLSYSWGVLFGKRDPMHDLPSDKSIWTAGFVQLYNTGKHIAKHYRALKWFYISIAMSDAALNAIATISITYMADQLQFTAQENGIAIGSMLLGSVPGAMLASTTVRRSDPIKSSMASLALLVTTTTLFAIFLTGPGQQVETYVLAVIWGCGTGWKWTNDRLVASCIIPEGQDAELMGFFLFSGQCFSWVPPLVYTAINEAGVSQRVGVASLNVYFVVAFVCYWLMSGYARAREEVGRESTFVEQPKRQEENAGGVITIEKKVEAELEDGMGTENYAEVETALPSDNHELMSSIEDDPT